jgi:phosphopantothenoylcysteine decarboxylase/phosphopantothenate--cysteine ligase
LSNNSKNPDLKVDIVSNSLNGVKIDLVIGGSVGAVESVRFIRSLRRLGADVTPILSKGAKLFTTVASLEWASNNKVIDKFDGSAPHIATGDLCLICPSSASLISKIASGICDSPATTIIQSYLGFGNKKVQLLPNMHHSLIDSPIVSANLDKIKKHITVLEPRKEEGKSKFPEPAVLADIVSHNYLKKSEEENALVCMGSTKGFFDDVRYVSNYSSGGLGTKITEELYRYGLSVHVVCGSSTIKPNVSSSIQNVETNEEMLNACLTVLKRHDNRVHTVMLASVLDYIPEQRLEGKTRSGADELSVKLVPTKKIISELKPQPNYSKIGFKLEPDLTEQEAQTIAKDYIGKYSLSKMVLNSLGSVSSTKHSATMFKDTGNKAFEPIYASSKQEIASAIRAHIVNYPHRND